MKRADIGKNLIVIGSFVTQKDTPNDIDVLLVLKDDVDEFIGIKLAKESQMFLVLKTNMLQLFLNSIVKRN